MPRDTVTPKQRVSRILCEGRGCSMAWKVAVLVGWRQRFLCKGCADEWKGSSDE